MNVIFSLQIKQNALIGDDLKANFSSLSSLYLAYCSAVHIKRGHAQILQEAVN